MLMVLMVMFVVLMLVTMVWGVMMVLMSMLRGRIVATMKSILIGVVMYSVVLAMSVHVRKVTFHIAMAIALLVPRLWVMIVTRVVAKLVRIVAMKTLLVVLRSLVTCLGGVGHQGELMACEIFGAKRG